MWEGEVGLVFWDIPGFIFFWNFSLLLHLCSVQKKKAESLVSSWFYKRLA